MAKPSDRGRTWAQLYYREGLLAKSNDGGPGEIPNDPLGYLVAAHIGYEKDSREKKIADRSQLISFSSKIESAGYFEDRTRRKNLVRCPIEVATHFIWRLTLPELLPTI